jgi:hypothetical protein
MLPIPPTMFRSAARRSRPPHPANCDVFRNEALNAVAGCEAAVDEKRHGSASSPAGLASSTKEMSLG